MVENASPTGTPRFSARTRSTSANSCGTLARNEVVSCVSPAWVLALRMTSKATSCSLA